MNCRFLLVGFLAIATAVVQAKPLSPEEALRRVENTENAPSKAVQKFKTAPQLALTVKSAAGEPAVYLFDTNENGFMIVSADDRAEALLGFGDTPIADGSSMPGNLRWWLNQYAMQIETAPERSNTIAVSYPVGEIAPMLATGWDQSSPYNDQCPLIYNAKTMTGCLATAMAQVMKYFNYPDEGTGSISYTNAYGTFAMDFGAFDWNNMLNKYTNGNYTAEQAEAVAYLMKSCGYSLQMAYSSTESAALISDCYNALVNYFKYDKNIHLVMRDYYPLVEWDNMLYDNLKNVGPVIYTGTDGSAGHAFVCDGYSSDGYFHINWGWSGAYNGYFRTTALKPSGVGIGGGSGEGYNFGQAMLLGVQPLSETSQAPKAEVLQSGDLNISYSYANYTRTLTLSIANYGMFTHYNNPDLEFRLGIILEYPDGEYQEYCDEYFNLSQWRKIPYGYGVMEYIVTLDPYLMRGTYKVYPACKIKGQDGYQRILAPLGAIDHGILTVGADGNSARPADKLALSGKINEVKTDFYIGNNFHVNVDVSNPNDKEIISAVYLGFAHKSTGTLAARSDQKAVSLLAGEETSIAIFSGFQDVSNLTAGEYNLNLYDANTGALLDSRTCTVQANPGAAMVESSSFAFVSDENAANPLSLNFEADIKCTSGYFSQGFEVLIYPYDEYFTQRTVLATFNSDPLFLNAGETAKINITGDFMQGEPGTSYAAKLAWYDETSYRYYTLYLTTFTIPVPQSTGIESTNANARQGAVEYLNLQGIKVPNPKHGEIYLRRTGSKVEKVLYNENR